MKSILFFFFSICSVFSVQVYAENNCQALLEHASARPAFIISGNGGQSLDAQDAPFNFDSNDKVVETDKSVILSNTTSGSEQTVSYKLLNADGTYSAQHKIEVKITRNSRGKIDSIYTKTDNHTKKSSFAKLPNGECALVRSVENLPDYTQPRVTYERDLCQHLSETSQRNQVSSKDLAKCELFFSEAAKSITSKAQALKKEGLDLAYGQNNDVWPAQNPQLKSLLNFITHCDRSAHPLYGTKMTSMSFSVPARKWETKSGPTVQ